MNNIFLIIFSICISCTVQAINLDSLWSIWNNSNKADTIRLKAIKQISEDGYLYSQPDSAFYFAQLQYKFAEEKGIKKQMADALNTQGISFSIRNSYANAINYFFRSLKIREEINDKRGIASCLNNIGNIYRDRKNYSKAIEYYTRSLKIREEISDKQGIASSLNNIGIINKQRKNYSKAIKYYTRSLKIMEKTGNKEGIAACLNNIGNIYRERKNYSKAIEYYTRSLKITKEIGNKRGMALSLNNIGVIYCIEGDSAENVGNTVLSAKKYTKFINYSKRALTIAKEVNSMLRIKDAANNLYKGYKHIGNFKAALKMHELYIFMRDSIENIETQKKVIQQEYKYEYEKQVLSDSLIFVKQQEVNALIYRNKLNKERYILLAGFALLLILLGVYLRIRFIKTQAEKNELLQKIKLLKAETIAKIAFSSTLAGQLQLNKEKIEAAIDNSLNQSDWKILNVLYNNPAIGNQELAKEVSLSIGGTRSSLTKMYQLFGVKTARNQRLSLIIEVTKLSNMP